MVSILQRNLSLKIRTLFALLRDSAFIDVFSVDVSRGIDKLEMRVTPIAESEDISPE